MNRYPARDAGFHREVNPCPYRPVPDVGAAERHQFLIRRYDGFPVRDRAVDDLVSHARSANEFRHDVDLGMRNHLPPVGSLQDIAWKLRQVLGMYGPAAQRSYGEREAKFPRYLPRAFGQNGQRARSNIAQPNDADTYTPHKVIVQSPPVTGAAYDEVDGTI